MDVGLLVGSADHIPLEDTVADVEVRMGIDVEVAITSHAYI